MASGLLTFGARFRAREVVEVRSLDEILKTLDERGMLEGTPFMPEMIPYCGNQFVVENVGHKLCDTINYSGMRRVRAAVYLEGLRCDGAAHGGCEAGCLILWKEAWLRRPGEGGREDERNLDLRRGHGKVRGKEDLLTLTGSGENRRYVCQVTELLSQSRPIAWWDVRQYLADYVSGNVRLSEIVRVLGMAFLRRLIHFGLGYRVFKRTYDRLALRFGMPSYAEVSEFTGPIRKGEPTPACTEEFAHGDWVRIKSREEILRTLNAQGRNRGIHFDPEMVPYCGGTYEVRGVVRKIIEEGTGKMLEMKNPCIALQSVACRSEYSTKRLLCPRAIYPYWRPIWLERAEPPRRTS